MGERDFSRRRRKRRQKRFLIFLLILFLLGCIGFVVVKKNPDLLDWDEIEVTLRDAILQVPKEVRELRNRELPEESEVSDGEDIADNPEVSNGEDIADSPEVSDGENIADSPEVSDGEDIADGPEVSDGEDIADGPEVSDGTDGPGEAERPEESAGLVGSEAFYEYYYGQLSDTEKRIYRELLEGIQERKREIYVSSSESAAISRAFRAIGLDHCELFWLHNHLEAFQTVYPAADYGIFEIAYLYSDEEVAEIHEAMEQVWAEVSQLTAQSADTYGQVQTVYTYLIDSVEYVESEHDQSIAGAFWKKECVCAGYTRAAQYLLNRMGIPCIFVSGDTIEDGTSHSWNVVEIEGAHYYVDATNGDQTSFLEGDATELASHKTTLCDYLCPIPAEYEKMFVADTDFVVPACESDTYNFYVLNQGIFDTYDPQSLFEYCCMRLNNGAAVVRFKFTDAEEFRKVCDEWAKGDGIQEVAQYYLRMYNLQSIEYHIGILEQFYTMYIMF